MRRNAKYILTLCLLILMLLLTSCAIDDWSDPAEWAPIPTEVWKKITLTVGEQTLHGVLYDNETARLFAQKLPLTVELWNPAPGFAKAFDLEEAIPDIDQHTRLYELGGLAYWYPGPSVAIFHSDHLEQTIVPVVTIGRITDDVSIFADYEGGISIALVPSHIFAGLNRFLGQTQKMIHSFFFERCNHILQPFIWS